ncbi:MAG: 4-hydroxy-3-methylbut-2-enyl diphosphate reductase, partial [Bacteroidia bacterium]|nr:4-hydroxy-3-methylbut-2-enyl diphosphate reductase [Bacteroidia bacterium]
MNVFVSSPHGYCSGVIRAIELVKTVRAKHREGDVFVLGSIVHNEDVINEFTALGITTLRDKNKTPEELLRSIPINAVVVFTAHGHDIRLEQIAHDRKLKTYDATCPMVTSNHHLIIKELKNTHQVIYIGKKQHPEANAALSLGKDVFLIENIGDLDLSRISDESPLVINQTTLSHLELTELHGKLRALLPYARFADEICNATMLRQKAVMDLPQETQLVYVIGGENSSNTASLVKIASHHLPHARVIRLLNEKEINEKDLIGLNH